MQKLWRAERYLQAQGLGSRRDCLQLIKKNRVRLNQAPLAEWVNPCTVTSLSLDHETLIIVPVPFFYIALHKPAGYETSHQPRHYPAVFQLLPPQLQRLEIQAVGRLDADTTGLLLLTNDGAFNHRLTSPKYRHAKRYRVTLKHVMTDDFCQRLLDGVVLRDGVDRVAAVAAERIDNHTLMLEITEGRYHQVKRMVAAAGNRVEALHRFQFAALTLPEDLASGQWCFIEASAVEG